MFKNKKHSAKAAALLGAPVLFFGLAACGSDQSQQAVETVTENASAPTESSSAEISTAETSEQTGTAKLSQITFGGEKLDTALYAPVKCEHETDDGREERNFDAGKDDSRHDFQIEFSKDLQHIESIDLEIDDVDWEMDDGDRGSAKITEKGDELNLKATLTKDDSQEKKDVEAIFSC